MRSASTLMENMSANFGEKYCQGTLRDCLKYIGDSSACGKTDLTLVFHNKPAINIELKDDLGAGGNNPLRQNIFYYAHLTKCDTCLDPMLLEKEKDMKCC